ncbi:MAG: hypothetical protein DWQ06_14465 [Calditrichaeota bacterium]|nr:MAG: hypothetical protein DWQ06_14465 [Calditrichota bacterium]
MKAAHIFLTVLLSIIFTSVVFAQTNARSSVLQKTARQLRIENENQVQAVHKEARQKIENLELRIKNLEDRSQEIELQKEIEKVKRQAEIDGLKLRLEFYKAKGDKETSQEIETALEKLQNPEKFRPELPKENRRETPKATAR